MIGQTEKEQHETLEVRYLSCFCWPWPFFSCNTLGIKKQLCQTHTPTLFLYPPEGAYDLCQTRGAERFNFNWLIQAFLQCSYLVESQLTYL